MASGVVAQPKIEIVGALQPDKARPWQARLRKGIVIWIMESASGAGALENFGYALCFKEVKLTRPA